MQCAFYLTHASRKAAARIRIVCTLDFYDITICVLYNVLTFDYVCTFEAYLSSRGKTEKLFRRIFHKVIPLYVNLTGERHRMSSSA